MFSRLFQNKSSNFDLCFEYLFCVSIIYKDLSILIFLKACIGLDLAGSLPLYSMKTCMGLDLASSLPLYSMKACMGLDLDSSLSCTTPEGL